MRKRIIVLLLAVSSLAVAGCGDDTVGTSTPPPTVDGGMDATTLTDGGGDAADSTAPESDAGDAGRTPRAMPAGTRATPPPGTRATPPSRTRPTTEAEARTEGRYARAARFLGGAALSRTSSK
jgi:hypothetical protein